MAEHASTRFLRRHANVLEDSPTTIVQLPYPNVRPRRVKMEELARKFLDLSLPFNVNVQQDTPATDVRPSWIRVPQTRARTMDSVCNGQANTPFYASVCQDTEVIVARLKSMSVALSHVAMEVPASTR